MQGKHIILGITGSIAAYKAAYLVRGFIKKGAEVKIIMTENAKQFITPLTMATLSQNPIAVDFFDPTNGEWHSHVELGLWADVFLVAPATANTIGKMANGIADNLLTTTFLSAKCATVVVPAMDVDMYTHPAMRNNLNTLRNMGVSILEPETGELASGLLGKGRMPEPETILEYMESFFNKEQFMSKKKVLITAGPTYEKIDPVRFIGNYSSGKMGYALADECAKQGAEVCLISGPVSIKPTHNNIKVISVESANEMYIATNEQFKQVDIAILCAAVADFTPDHKDDNKIKRTKDSLTLNLVPTQDIASELGKSKKTNQILVGFALETNDETANAIDKLKRKNLDFIVLNSLNDDKSCFGYDTNKICIIDKKGVINKFPLKDKREVAKDIINKITTWKD
ncbi:MAG: bifunctional phosphopantothenoylcysteine decarboxylase/phosphopantothenate--cysteine ligase CoaBC [Bacteroidia bacterium]|nr:bifunctional phosphopantothenoylcysteine decarboxylase/phosphopantothenate--cysteine ligase CoaBC [Bacteroidia bacterium]